MLCCLGIVGLIERLNEAHTIVEVAWNPVRVAVRRALATGVAQERPCCEGHQIILLPNNAAVLLPVLPVLLAD
jgi:hypothetical protein